MHLAEVVVALEQKAKESPRIGWQPASLGTQGTTRATSSSTFGALPASLGTQRVDRVTSSSTFGAALLSSETTTHMFVLHAMLNL